MYYLLVHCSSPSAIKQNCYGSAEKLSCVRDWSNVVGVFLYEHPCKSPQGDNYSIAPPAGDNVSYI